MTVDNLTHAGQLASGLPGLLLEAERVAHTLLKGVHGRRRAGMGETFWQFRNYIAGDSSRDIDWRQTAKRDDAYVRQLEWEASQTAWLWRDASESMNFRSRKHLHTKKDFAEVLLLALAMVLLNGGEQVNLLGTDMQAQIHSSAIEKIYSYLPQQTHLGEGARPVTARSQAIIMSDFYFPIEQLVSFCEPLALRHVRGVLVQVCDPLEESLELNGRVKFLDMENINGESVTLPSVEAVRDVYQQKFLQHREMLKAKAKSFGWQFFSFSTQDKLEQSLSALFEGLVG